MLVNTHLLKLKLLMVLSILIFTTNSEVVKIWENNIPPAAIIAAI